MFDQTMFDNDPLSALEALTAAQWLAFAPLAHQATAVMRDRGVLAALGEAPSSQGCTIDDVARATRLSTRRSRWRRAASSRTSVRSAVTRAKSSGLAR